jgi:hypothetical protein
MSLPPPPGGVMLERLVMLGTVTLIAIGIVTAFFWQGRDRKAIVL